MRTAVDTSMAHDRILSSSTEKLTLYREDAYFFESWFDVQEELTDEQVRGLLLNHGSIIIKPEAFISGRALDILKFYRSRKFRPVAFRTIEFDRHMVRALWRFQLNAATRERLHLLDEWASLSKMVFVILQDTASTSEHAVSTKITQLRGHSNPQKHRSGELRMALGQEITMINFLHSADEPADMIRDLGVLLSTNGRRTVLREILKSDDCSTALEVELQELSALQDETDISVRGVICAITRRHNRPDIEQRFTDCVDRGCSIAEMNDLIQKEELALTQVERIILLARMCKLVRSATSSKIRSILTI